MACILGVRIEFSTRLETRTKESNVHASLSVFILIGEAHAKSTKFHSLNLQCSPNLSLGKGLEFEHVMLGPEKRRAMLE